MGRYITALLCHLACASAMAAEPTTAVGQDALRRVAAAGLLTQNEQEVLRREEPIYLVAHTAADCPICKVWRASSTGLSVARQLSDTWPHVHFVLIDRRSLYSSEDESLYPPELNYLFQGRKERYQLSPPTPLFEVVVRNHVVLRLGGLQAWNENVVPAIQELERTRETASSSDIQPSVLRKYPIPLGVAVTTGLRPIAVAH
jgi:hypothetical protein